MPTLKAPNLRLVIDGGKTKTLVVVVDGNGVELARSTGPGLAIIETPYGFEQVVASLNIAVEGLGVSAEFHTACIGLNGVLGAGPEPTALALSALQSVASARRYIVTSDAVTSYVGALGVTPGVVIAAGTGSVILAVGRDGSLHPVDGSGPLCGDRGSGYDIGRQGIHSALRFADGMVGSQCLHNQVVEAFGGTAEVLRAMYTNENPSKVIASFSRGVALAATEGDATAREIWGRAARDLAEGAVAAARAAALLDAPFPVATVGGLFDAGEVLWKPLVRELSKLAPLSSLTKSAGDSLLGGIRLSLSAESILTSVSTWVESDSLVDQRQELG